MARKPTRNIQKETTGKKSNRRPMIVLWVSIVLVILLIFAIPTVIVLFFGMLPSFVAFIIDRTREKYNTFCVAGMNLCGVFPYVLDLWLNNHTIFAAIENLTNVFSLLVMYGAAGFGWFLYSSVPPIISSFLSVLNQKRVITLRARQKTLINEWGESVAHKEIASNLDAEKAALGPSSSN